MRTMKSKRIEWIDQLKAVAFALVVLGHVELPKEVQSFIYSFHMPLFFTISGMTIDCEKVKNISWGNFVKNKAKHLLIPYFWMNFLSYPLWYYAFHHLSNTKLTISGAFLGIFVGNSLIIGAPSNACYFLLVLFLSNVLLKLILYIEEKTNTSILVLLSICALLGYTDRAVNQIWHFNVAFTACVFMYYGCYLMKRCLTEKKLQKEILLLCLITVNARL